MPQTIAVVFLPASSLYANTHTRTRGQYRYDTLLIRYLVPRTSQYCKRQFRSTLADSPVATELNALCYLVPGMHYAGDRLLASVVRAPAFLPTDHAGEAPDDQPTSLAACSGAFGEH